MSTITTLPNGLQHEDLLETDKGEGVTITTYLGSNHMAVTVSGIGWANGGGFATAALAVTSAQARELADALTRGASVLEDAK